MPPTVATGLTILFVLWLFARDHAIWRECSAALWIPVLWIVIIGSRPISSWLGYQVEGADADLEGSPVDRLFYLVLILAAFIVLQRRQINWTSLIAQNKWLAAYFIYLGVSALWSDNPFVSFKRWIKDIGNIFMVVIILSERDPVEALKSVVFRCSCFLVPMSVLFIKFYPDLGRYLDRWTWQYHYGGVTTDKNSLGMSLFLCGLGLSWSFLDLWNRRSEDKKDLFAHLLLMGMCLWLWAKANCATSLVCTVLGVSILLGMRVRAVRAATQQIGLWGFLIVFLIALFLNALFNPVEMVTGGLGRNMTLTGRTEIWHEALQVDINPLIGTGYCSFWQGDRAVRVSEDLGFFFQLKEAHNGYLDTYLNSGLIGLALVIATLIASGKKVIKSLEPESSYAAFRLAVLLGAVIYNMTESALCGLLMLWVMLLLAVVELRRSSIPSLEKKTEHSPADPDKLHVEDDGGGFQPGNGASHENPVATKTTLAETVFLTHLVPV